MEGERNEIRRCERVELISNATVAEDLLSKMAKSLEMMNQVYKFNFYVLQANSTVLYGE